MASITRACSAVPMRKRSATTSSTFTDSLTAAALAALAVFAFGVLAALASGAAAARCTTRSACTRV
ncbi:hypothetical protein FQZ97_1189520 [compost metagenome]